MKRRAFSTAVLGACAVVGTPLLVAAPPVAAQGGVPVEGKDYQRLSTPLPAPTNGKVEVLDFFWYSCPHCNAFGPQLDAWIKKLPADVQVKRVPVAFRESNVAQQRIYYALEEMKLVEAMHRRVFAAIHVDHLALDQPNEIAAWMTKNGVDGTKFLEYYNSFSVQTKARQATQLAQAYRLDGVPAIGVQGRYLTSPSMAGSPERALMVASFLIEKSRGKS
jgi:protein dithiol oxidoreductase (disulfide-forming)